MAQIVRCRSGDGRMENRAGVFQSQRDSQMERDCVRRTSRSAGWRVRRGNNPDALVNPEVLRLGFATAALRAKPRRGDILVVQNAKTDSSSVRSGIGCRPQGPPRRGLGNFFGRCCYNDFTPDGAEAKHACSAMMDMDKIDIAKGKLEEQSLLSALLFVLLNQIRNALAEIAPTT